MKLDELYTTPDQSHSMMEPHASIAAWNGDKLTVWTSNQMIDWGRTDLATTLGIPKDNVRFVSPYIGGGFGCKLFLRSDAVMAALGAKAAGRPVKVALPRPFVPNNTTHRPATRQRIRIGAGADGRIIAIAHESGSGDLPDGQPETATNQTRLLYAGANRLTSMRLAVLDLPEGNAMRAPGEAPGMMALEIAMDELAEKLGLDPVELRVRNDTQVDPEKPDRPFSQRNLVRCLREGAERFGWRRRNASPGAVRDGHWLVGMGTAAAFRNNLLIPSGARVRLGRDGLVVVETDMTDIGTGSYTIIAQTAAEMMGVDIEKVVVRLGDSAFPVSVRIRRAVRRELFDFGRLRGLRKASGSRCAAARLQLGGGDVLGRPGAEWQPFREAGRRRPRRRTRRRGQDGMGRPRQELPAVDLRRPLRRGGRRRLHRRGSDPPHARGVRRRPNPQSH